MKSQHFFSFLFLFKFPATWSWVLAATRFRVHGHGNDGIFLFDVQNVDFLLKYKRGDVAPPSSIRGPSVSKAFWLHFFEPSPLLWPLCHPR